jgi:hypothetical protein
MDKVWSRLATILRRWRILCPETMEELKKERERTPQEVDLCLGFVLRSWTIFIGKLTV